MANDFFLGSVVADFLESARQLVFETYARTHQCIDINLLADRLDIKPSANAAAPAAAAAADGKAAPNAGAGASSAAAAGAKGDNKSEDATVEQALVNLIRNARVDVKIDAKKNQIVMDARSPSM
jgi:hypothetical protein